MTKAKLHETLINGLTELKASAKVLEFVDDLTKPKLGGGSSVEDYTVVNEQGETEFIFCAYHQLWEPVANEDDELLYRENAKVKNGYDRSCIEGGKQWQAQAKIFTASKAAIITEVLDTVITGSEAKEAIAKLDADRQIHTPREDGIGEDERPVLEYEDEDDIEDEDSDIEG